MFNVCYRCGSYRADKEIDPERSVAICPNCGYAHPFRQLPLLLIGGASGAGKSTLCQLLTGQVTNAVLLDADILWQPSFNTPQDNYRSFFETWLRMAKNIGQSGRPVVIFGAGFVVPANVEPCIERRYFSRVHYLGLTCDEETLTARLRARPRWRESSGEEFIAGQIHFNRWIIETGPSQMPSVERIDTAASSPAETVSLVHEWITRNADLPTGD